jgi:hypothetical protein
VRDRDGLSRAIAVLCYDEVRFTAAGVISLECIGPMQENYHVRILFYGSALA